MTPAFRIRSSHQWCPIKKLVLKNFTILTGKQLWITCNISKKRLQHKFFPVNISKFWRTPILKNICKRLLLQDYNRPEKQQGSHDTIKWCLIVPTTQQIFTCLESIIETLEKIAKTINTQERRHWSGSGIFIVNFEIVHTLFLSFLLMTLSKGRFAG